MIENIIYSEETYKKVHKKINDQFYSLLQSAQKNAHYKKNFNVDWKKVTKKNLSIKDLPFTNRDFFYQYPLDKNFTYLLKGRPSENYQEPRIPFSKNDYKHFVEMEKYEFQKCGVKKGDTFAITNFAHSMLAPMTSGVLELGAQFVGLEGNNEEKFRDLKEKNVDSILSTFTTINQLIEYVRLYKLKINLKTIILTGEKVTDIATFRKKVKKYLGAQLVDIIGSKEIPCGYAYSFEKDLYTFETKHHLIEIINPKTGNYSKKGELVITPLWRKDLPLLRFKMEDMVEITVNKNNQITFKGITGRVDGRNKVHGIFIDPLDIYAQCSDVFLHQYTFDKYIWKFFKAPAQFLILIRFNQYDKLLFLTDKYKSLLFMRNSNFLSKIDTIDQSQVIHMGIKNNEIQALIDFAKGKKFIDIRTLDEKKYPTPVKKIIDKYNLKSL